MKIKKYLAGTMHEAMKQIRSELGNDAVILNSKELETGGFLGFFTKKQVEVIVAIDPGANEVQASRNEQVETPLLKKSPPVPEKQTHLLKEINQLKQLVHTLNDRVETGHTRTNDYPEPFQQIENHLRAQGVAESIRYSLLKQLLKKWYEQETKAVPLDDDIRNDLHHYIEEQLSEIPIGPPAFDKRIINIVGPTGVGKTTTIAKIAAECVLKKQKKVVLITTDTYRIAAVEQLKTYAKILNIPLEVAYSVDDFKRSIEQYAHYDLIIVDSAGRNFRNRLYVEELSKVIDFEHEADTFLVLSLTSKYEDMKEIVNQFSLIPFEKVILTKKDETSSYGAMLNIPIELGKGIAYITTGQNVPDDIIEPSIPYVKQCVLAGVSNE
ncbi:flagellar biosynthesis protein FlhF [bacterium LRH843]|nr:flagellar biosynthesis protein FlhF [bacterium LRH843]